MTRSLGERNGDRIEQAATDVWVARADGSAPRRLTHAGDATSSVFAPDGQAVALTHLPLGKRATRNGPPISTAAIWRVPLRGGAERRVTDPPTGAVDLAGAFSPDGAELAFARCDTTGAYASGPTHVPCGVFVVRSDGTGLRRLAAHAVDPSFTPDGRSVYHASDDPGGRVMVTGSDESGYAYDIYGIRPDGSGATDLTSTPGTSETGPTLSPGGPLLAYTERSLLDFTRRVVVADADAGCRRPLAVRGEDAAAWLSTLQWRPGSATLEQPRLCR